MFFLNEDSRGEILFVGFMNWPAGHHSVKPRPVDALTFRLKGKGTIRVGQTVYEVKENDLLFLPRNLAYVADYEDTQVAYFHFIAGEEWTSPEAFTPSNPAAFRAMLSACVADWEEDLPGRKLRAEAYLLEILTEIFRQCGEKTEGLSPAAKTAVRLLRERFRDPEVNVSAVCAAAGISEGHFRRVFRSRFGTSPVEYLTRLRLEAARKLLGEGSVSVSQAAYMTGFSDAKYFSRVVKKVYGCTPSQLILR